MRGALDLVRFVVTHPLNQDHKLEALMRMAKWQLGSRLVPGAVVFDWVNASKLLIRRGDKGLTGNVYSGLHESADMAFLLHVLRADDLFIDVGANAGSYTVLACAAAGATGYAFEPIPATYRRLMENVRLNDLESRVQCLNVGLGSEPGRLAFCDDLDTSNHVLPEEPLGRHAITVEVSTLDRAIHAVAPAVAKIDVEGFETPVLQGASATLQNPLLHSVVMELNGSGERYGFDESHLIATMFEHGFRTYRYDLFARRLVALHGKNVSSGNTLFIRDERFVTDRIASAPKFELYGRWM
jgi:FkbM family methyltransferase